MKKNKPNVYDPSDITKQPMDEEYEDNSNARA